MLKQGKVWLQRASCRSDRRRAEILIATARSAYEQTGRTATFEAVMAEPDTPSPPEDDDAADEEWLLPEYQPPTTQPTQETHREGRPPGHLRNVRGRHGEGSTQGQRRWRP
jgi:hypothetical protein